MVEETTQSTGAISNVESGRLVYEPVDGLVSGTSSFDYHYPPFWASFKEKSPQLVKSVAASIVEEYSIPVIEESKHGDCIPFSLTEQVTNNQPPAVAEANDLDHRSGNKNVQSISR